MTLTSKASASKDPASDKLIRYGTIVFAAILIIVAFYCRIRLLSVPLERDEGGFAYIGQQILRGIPPFESGNMKLLAGMHFAYALIMAIFGESSKGIHIGLLMVNLISMPFMYLLARRMLTVEAATLTVGAYAFLSVSQSVLGVFAHATHFVMLFVLAGLVVLFKGLEENRRSLFFASGLCFGLAVLMKQHGIFFCLLALCVLACKRPKQPHRTRVVLLDLTALGLGMLAPYIATCIYMIAKGVFTEFWFWTFTYSLDYAGANTLAQGLHYLKQKMGIIYLYQKFALFLGGFGLLATCYPGNPVPNRLFLLGFFFVAFFATTPGNFFYRHYFVLLIPALSLLIGVAFEALSRVFLKVVNISVARIIAFGLTCFAFVSCVYAERDYLFSLSSHAVSRKLYRNDLFPVSVAIARYIRENSNPQAKLAVIGSEPQLYFYAQRVAATAYLYMYSLDRPHANLTQMQDEMIREIEMTSPEYIVYVDVYDSWARGLVGDRILDWTNNYLLYYYKVGFVQLGGGTESITYWGTDAESFYPTSGQQVSIYRRRF